MFRGCCSPETHIRRIVREEWRMLCIEILSWDLPLCTGYYRNACHLRYLLQEYTA